jgi:hypothetical protein
MYLTETPPLQVTWQRISETEEVAERPIQNRRTGQAGSWTAIRTHRLQSPQRFYPVSFGRAGCGSIHHVSGYTQSCGAIFVIIQHTSRISRYFVSRASLRLKHTAAVSRVRRYTCITYFDLSTRKPALVGVPAVGIFGGRSRSRKPDLWYGHLRGVSDI